MGSLENSLNQLKEIKPPVIIDISFYEILYYGGISIIAASILALLWSLLFNRRKRRRLSPKEIALNELKNLNFEDTKEAVYKFSINSKLLAKNEQKSELYGILHQLEKYKYRKDIPELEQKDIEVMKSFIKELKL
jgi:hypothetical protein